MKTSFIFKIDEKVKKAAQKKAKKAGITLSDFYNLATRKFIEGEMTVDIVGPEIPNAKTARELAQAFKDIEMGKNIFSTPE